MTNDENSNTNAFCVLAMDAQRFYFLDKDDIRNISHRVLGEHCHNDSFKIYTPTSLEAAAIKKFGTEGFAARKRERQVYEETARKAREESRLILQQEKSTERKRKAAIPKWPLNRWARFQKEEIDNIRRVYPCLQPRDYSPMLSRRYRALSVEQRKVLDEKHAADKVRFYKELKVYENEFGPLKRSKYCSY